MTTNMIVPIPQCVMEISCRLADLSSVQDCSSIYLVCEWETSDHVVDSTVQKVYQRYQSVKSRSYQSVDCLMQAMTISFMY